MSAGQVAGSRPWVRNSARATRSRPKPMQAVWAAPPSAVWIPEGLPEIVEVVVAGGDGGRLLLRADGHHQLVLEHLLPLGGLREAPSPTEERVVCHHGLHRESERLQERLAAGEPQVAMAKRLFMRAQPHVLPLAEDLHPRWIIGGLVAEYVGDEVHQPAGAGHHPRHRGVERVAGGGHEHELARREVPRPVFAGRERLDHRLVFAIPAGEGVDGAQQVREVVDVVDPLVVRPGEQRGEEHHLGRVGRAGGGDQRFETLDHPFKDAAAPIDPAHPGRDEQAGLHQLVEERAVRIGAAELRHALRTPAERSGWWSTDRGCGRC